MSGLRKDGRQLARPLRAALMLSVSIGALAFSESAWAACTPASPASGATITCDGAGLPAFAAAAGVTGLTVNITAPSTVTGVARTVAGTNAQYSSLLVNDSSTINNLGSIIPTLAASAARDYVGVNLNGSDTSLVNRGSITVTNAGTLTGSGAYRLYGVISSSATATDFENVAVTNYGSITLTQTGAANGISRGIYSGESIDSMSVDNYGTITLSRVATSTNALAAIDADDDTDDFQITNHAGAVMSVTGANSYTIGGRAGNFQILNSGTITNIGGKAAILIYGAGGGGGDDDDDDSGPTLTNTKGGTINGAIIFSDANPITGGNIPDSARSSSTINQGTINGSFFYYGLGTHTLDNTGTINGGINVDQTVFTSTGGDTPSFTLTNEGTISGNIGLNEIAGSSNVIGLTGTGFRGSVTANGSGSNSLTLSGVTALASVSGFTDLNLMQSNVTVAGGVSLVSDQNAATPATTLETAIFGPGGTLAAPSTNLGSINGTLTLGGPTTITPTFNGVARNGDVYRIATSIAGDTADITIVNTSALVTLTPDTSSGGLQLNAAVQSAASVGAMSRPATATLNSLLSYNGNVASVQALGGAVESLTSLSQVRQAAEQLKPEVNGASTQVPIDLTTAFQTQIGNRLDSLFYGALAGQQGRSADYYPPRPPVIIQPSSGAWGNGVGSFTEQQSVAGASGYRAQGGGAIVGYDRLFDNQYRFGGAFGYATSEVTDNVYGRRQSIDLYQGLLYGSYTQSNWYVNGSFGVAGLNYDTTRSIIFTNFNDTAKGSHSGMLYSGRLDSGYAFNTSFGILVPVGSFTYVHIDQDAYRETSMAGAGLSYARQETDSARSGLGLKAVFPFVLDPNFAFAFEAKGVWEHEFADTAQAVTASFVGADASFLSTGPALSRNMADVGAGFRFSRPRDGESFSVSYNAIVRERYVDHIGMLKARIDF